MELGWRNLSGWKDLSKLFYENFAAKFSGRTANFIDNLVASLYDERLMPT